MVFFPSQHYCLTIVSVSHVSAIYTSCLPSFWGMGHDAYTQTNFALMKHFYQNIPLSCLHISWWSKLLSCLHYNGICSKSHSLFRLINYILINYILRQLDRCGLPCITVYFCIDMTTKSSELQYTRVATVILLWVSETALCNPWMRRACCVTLKLILKKLGERLWTMWIWLRIGTSGGILWTW